MPTTTTPTTGTFRVNPTGNLNIIPTFKALMKSCVDQDSIYMLAKASMRDYFVDGSTAGEDALTKREQAELLSSLVKDLTVSLTGKSMDMAYQMAVEDRYAPYKLADTEEQIRKSSMDRIYIGAKIDSEAKKLTTIESEIDYKYMSIAKLAADSLRTNGIELGLTTTASAKVSLTDKHSSTFFSVAQVQARSAKVKSYTSIAASLRQNGNISWDSAPFDTLDSSTKYNITSVKLNGTGADAYLRNGLAHYQSRVSDRQYTAFEDNKRQHVANSSASTISMLLTADAAPSGTSDIVSKYKTALTYLNSNS